MRRRDNVHSVDALFLVITFLIFAFSAISALILAVQFYQGTVARSDTNESSRVAVAYLRESVHQSDVADGVSVVSFDGQPCIELASEEGYVRRLYFYEGNLRDMYARTDATLTAADGEAVVELEEMTISEENGNIVVKCKDKYGVDKKIVVASKTGN